MRPPDFAPIDDTVPRFAMAHAQGDPSDPDWGRLAFDCVEQLGAVAGGANLGFMYLPAYRGVLEGGALAEGERAEAGKNYESLFANPLSGAPPRAYLAGALVLAAALLFYWRVVPGLNGPTGLWTLAVPTLVFAAGLARALVRKGTIDA